ncbi:MAG: tetratricopeptide repeat protein [Promethearchaeota archaeon]
MSSGDQNFEQLLSRARSLKQQGQNKKSIDAYRQALELDQSNIDALNEMGLIHILIGEQTLAVVAFDLAISVKPDDSRAYCNKAEAYLTMGSFEEALEAATEGLKIVNSNADLWTKKARSLESLFKIDEAIVAYNEALKLNSEDPEIWKALALCMDALEMWDEVARAYEIAAGLHEKRGENQDAESCMKFAELAKRS